MRKVALTTTDNPYDPFVQFDDWYAFDELKGYHTCSYLARIYDLFNVSNDISKEEKAMIEEQAIDRIVNLNVLGIYKKVVKE